MGLVRRAVRGDLVEGTFFCFVRKWRAPLAAGAVAVGQRRAPCESYCGMGGRYYALSLATRRRSLLMLSNWQPKYMVAT